MSEEAHADHGHHIVPDKLLNKTFGVLFGLMLLTIGAARIPFEFADAMPGLKPMIHQYYVPLWWLTNGIALGIAVWKSYFVIQNFMGVRFASHLVKLYVVAGFLGFAMLFIMFFDYKGREWEPVKGWEPSNSTAFPREALSKGEAGRPGPEYPGKHEGAEGH